MSTRKLEIEVAALQGKYVPREDVELELAARGIVLGATLKQAVHTRAPGWLSLVEGNPTRLPELVTAMNEAIAASLDDYATAEGFEVLVRAEEKSEVAASA